MIFGESEYNMQEIKSQQELYNKVADEYDATIPHHVALHYLKKRADFIGQTVKKGIILNVGCGLGHVDAELKKRGYAIVGIDLSKNMLLGAKKSINNLVCGSSTRLPFKSQCFSGSISIVVLHHLITEENVKATIDEMCRVVEDGGTIIVWDHNPANPYWKILMKKLPQDSGEERLVSSEEIVADFIQSGIKFVHIYKLGFVPEFAPKSLLPLFRVIEAFVERAPIIRRIAAHNVVVARK